jgi:hypothetical protein
METIDKPSHFQHRQFCGIAERPKIEAACRLGPRRPGLVRPVRIATYNVNGINGRLPVLLRWLELAEPDIVCLQELKAPDEKSPERPVRDLGYEAIWHGLPAWNWVAILTRVGSRPGPPRPARAQCGNEAC